jgi:hypothetical protein
MPPLTVATAVSDDCHVASAVTDRVVVSASAAIAVNCAVPPTAGAVPLTVSVVTFAEDGVVAGVEDIDDVEDGVVGELVHAVHTHVTATSSRRDASDSRFTSEPRVLSTHS